MTLVVIDGPEKAGKSTLVRALLNKGALVRKWNGPANPDWTQYLHAARRDHSANDLIVWDRGWPSEAVYPQMIDSREVVDQHKMEAGLRPFWGQLYILLGPDVQTLEASRNGTDLPVDPKLERQLYSIYADTFNYEKLENQHTSEYVENLALEIFRRYGYQYENQRAIPSWFGHHDPEITIVMPPSATIISYQGFLKLYPQALSYSVAFVNAFQAPHGTVTSTHVLLIGKSASTWFSLFHSTTQASVSVPWKAVYNKHSKIEKFFKEIDND